MRPSRVCRDGADIRIKEAFKPPGNDLFNGGHANAFKLTVADGKAHYALITVSYDFPPQFSPEWERKL